MVVKVSLEEELKKVFPELHVTIFTVSKANDIELPEFLSAVEYIKESKLIQDSEKLLSSNEPFNESVSYSLNLPNQKKDFFFEVGWDLTLDKYIGRIQLLNDFGDKVNQVTMYDMKLKG